MILILKSNTKTDEEEFLGLMSRLAALPNVQTRVHQVQGSQQTLTEVYLLGDTAALNVSSMQVLPCVDRVVRVSKGSGFRVLGRHADDDRATWFDYNGVRFGQETLHVFAGLCAVDKPENVELVMQALQAEGQVCTRMGAYKPRTSPYSFQGHGKTCLPYVFELAGKYGIKVVAMEITHDCQLEEIQRALDETGRATGVMVQIGTRNAQNFELLKAVGRQNDFPVLIKRGFGITLEESLHAAEYLASEGNSRVVFCLRGMKTHMGHPHRNLVDFAHVPVVKRLTRMPVCVDPSHSVGSRERGPEGILEIMHTVAQGVIAGANLVLVDFHPDPPSALVDGPQALRREELSYFLEDIKIVHEAYVKRVESIKKSGE